MLRVCNMRRFVSRLRCEVRSPPDTHTGYPALTRPGYHRPDTLNSESSQVQRISRDTTFTLHTLPASLAPCLVLSFALGSSG